MEQPLISLIIPMYNAEKYVRQCISCIKNQTYKNIDIVLVDDGSIDNTVELCMRAVTDMPNVKLIRTENHGASAARNTGLDCADGEYVVFADVDDYFCEDYIEYLANIAGRFNADIAVCNYKKTNNFENVKLKPNGNENIKIFTSIEALENVSYRKEISAGPIAKLIKKDITCNIRFYEKSAYWEDYLYVTEIIKNSTKVVYSSNIKYVYLQNAGSATHSNNCEKRIASWEILMDRLKKYTEIYPEIQRSFQAKALSASMDTLKGIYRSGYDETPIKRIVKIYGFSVAMDGKCTKLKRLLALMASINIDMTILAGRIALRLLSSIGHEL